MKKFVPIALLIIYICVAIRSGINPYETTTWFVEILTSAIPVVILTVMYLRGTRFSSLWYILMAILPIMHAIGAHYTFAYVPSQRLSDLLGTDRNMYDRIAHATVGLYAFNIIELIDMRGVKVSRWFKITYALFAIMSLAGLYELFERWYAMMSDPDAGLAILWSQGDIWDAQKDILMDTIGAIVGILIYTIVKRKNKI